MRSAFKTQQIHPLYHEKLAKYRYFSPCLQNTSVWNAEATIIIMHRLTRHVSVIRMMNTGAINVENVHFSGHSPVSQIATHI